MNKEPIKLDKVLGAFYGVAIGDALGMPVETWTAKEILEKFGLLTRYADPKNHKWFSGFKRGVTTDDYQLTEAFAKSLIACKGFNMDEVAIKFVESFSRRNIGWGRSTQTAAMKISLGENWVSSGKSDDPKAGTGNGVAMKIAPLAMMAYLEGVSLRNRDEKLHSYFRKAYDLAIMTHNKPLGISSAYAQFAAVLFCLEREASKITSEDLFADEFIKTIFYWCVQVKKSAAAQTFQPRGKTFP